MEATIFWGGCWALGENRNGCLELAVGFGWDCGDFSFFHLRCDDSGVDDGSGWFDVRRG
jgi:hypothetical protein